MRELPRRATGTLMHITSLDSPYGIGDLGNRAYRFVDFLARTGQSFWQVLPLGPTGYGDSPYQSFSAFAGNPYLISLDGLRRDGLITRRECAAARVPQGPVDYAALFVRRIPLLKKAFARFSPDGEYAAFCDHSDHWLDDYALYMALKYRFGQLSWLEWPEDIRLRHYDAVDRYRVELEREIGFWKFVQYIFFRQWRALKNYAGERGISVIGDMPLYVATDSADAWSHRENFLLEPDGSPTVVAGVPPDYFSETGQLWGNCIYDWDAMEGTDFSWWRRRMESAAELFDVVRIDHFCGICRYWAVPAGDETAENGEYRPGPGMKLIRAIDEARGDAGIIAEDLGLITPDVQALILASGYPGMRVSQFGFDGGEDNSHLPEAYPRQCVAYTGTHDNDTTLGYFAQAEGETLNRVYKVLELDPRRRPTAWDLIAHTMDSAAALVVIPMQDYLELGSEARMNTPSTIGGNWRWRMPPGALTGRLAQRVRRLVTASRRRAR